MRRRPRLLVLTARGRIALTLAALLLVAVALALLGRWEGDRAVHRELREMRRVLHLVGPTLTARTPSAYRPAETFACLDYRTSEEEPYGLELCFDAEGRLVETIDRRGGGIRTGSLREEPEASTIRVGVDTVLSVLRAAAPKHFPATVDELPVGGPDLGPIPLERGDAAATRD